MYPNYLSSHVPETWRADGERAGVDEQNIDASKRPAKSLRNLLLARPIEGDDQHIAAEFLAHRFECRQITGDGDTGAFIQELPGRFQADAAGGSGK